jgi:hypothetical protein
MKKHQYILSILSIAMLSVSGVQAAEVISTFSTGDTLTATKMTEIKNAVNDNDTRIGVLEVSAGDTLAELNCTSGQVAKFNGTSWACAVDENSSGTVYTGGTGIDVTGTSISISTGGVTSAELAADAVTASEIANNAVGLTEVSTDAINSSKIVDGSIVAADIDNTSVQQRLSMACAAGSSIRDIAADGTPTCEVDTDTTYTAGSGLSLTGTVFSVAPKTHYLMVPAASFRPVVSDTTFFGEASNPYQSITGGTLYTVAPVDVPHGATITGLSMRAWDTSTTNSVTIDLRKFSGFATTTSLASVSTTTLESVGFYVKEDNTISELVNLSTANHNYYYLVQTVESAASGSGPTIYAARVTYTY